MAAITLRNFKAEFNSGNYDKIAENGLVIVSADEGKPVHSDLSELNETDICSSSLLAKQLFELGVNHASDEDIAHAVDLLLA